MFNNKSQMYGVLITTHSINLLCDRNWELKKQSGGALFNFRTPSDIHQTERTRIKTLYSYEHKKFF